MLSLFHRHPHPGICMVTVLWVAILPLNPPLAWGSCRISVAGGVSATSLLSPTFPAYIQEHPASCQARLQAPRGPIHPPHAPFIFLVCAGSPGFAPLSAAQDYSLLLLGMAFRPSTAVPMHPPPFPAGCSSSARFPFLFRLQSCVPFFGASSLRPAYDLPAGLGPLRLEPVRPGLASLYPYRLQSSSISRCAQTISTSPPTLS